MTNTTDWEAELERIRVLTEKAVAELGLPPARPARKDSRDMTPATTGCTVGALLRRQLRRELMSVEEHGITFKEEKGLLDSNFYISGPKWAIDLLNELFADAFRRLDS